MSVAPHHINGFEVTNHPFQQYVHQSVELSKKGAESLEWLKELGVSKPADRYGEYFRVLASFGMNKDFAGEKGEEGYKEFYSFLNAHSEINELVRVHDALRNIEADEYMSILRKVVGGQPYRQHADRDPGRDFLFELSTASRLLRAGYEVRLNEFADVVIPIGSQNVYIEVKRIKSARQLGKRISEVNKQIQLRVSKDTSSLARGLVVVGLTDILNPLNEMVMVNSAEGMRQANADKLHEYISLKSSSFYRGRSKKALGVLSEFTMQGLLVKGERFSSEWVRLVNCRVSSFLKYSMGSADGSLARKIVVGMSNQALFR